MMTEVGVA